MPEDKPYRIQTNAGHRKYLCGGQYMASVTTVLSATESAKSKASLAQWNAKNPGASEEACKRGTAIHLCAENYLRGIDVNCPEEYLDYWRGVSAYLDLFDSIHWSERPLRLDWSHLKSDDGAVSYVWSTEHRYAGCPDLVGEIGGVKVIADFKTSSAPYRNSFPDRGDRAGYGGYLKYQKCAQQLGAYSYALNERVGFKCQAAMIIATTADTAQGIFIDRHLLTAAQDKFLKRADMFHSMFSSDEAENCSPQGLSEQDQS